MNKGYVDEILDNYELMLIANKEVMTKLELMKEYRLDIPPYEIPPYEITDLVEQVNDAWNVLSMCFNPEKEGVSFSRRDHRYMDDEVENLKKATRDIGAMNTEGTINICEDIEAFARKHIHGKVMELVFVF